MQCVRVLEKCSDCGEEYGIGEYPFCPHGVPRGMQTFHSYVDEHISTDGRPVEITSWAQKQKLLRPHWRDDHVVEVREKEPKPKGWFSARIDRAHEKRRNG